MKNYITKSNQNVSVLINKQTVKKLKACTPKGCPFENYTMFDLLKDWIQMYSWQITQRKISLIDFIKNINGDGKIAVYSDSMINLLTQ